MKNWILIICLTTSVSCAAQVPIPQEAHETIVRPDEPNSEGLVWNKWDTENFIILSLDKSQGLQIKNEIEQIRTEILSRWGVQGVSKSKLKTKLVCVPDSKMLERFFKIEKSHSEVRQDGSSAIWICFSDIKDLSKLVSNISLSNFPFFLQRGLLELDKAPEDIRKEIGGLKDFSASDVFSITKEKWSKMSDQEKDLFDKRSGLVCLLIRKEFGKYVFGKVVGCRDESSLLDACGFKGLDNFNSTLSRYYANLTEDIKINKTPDTYLMIR